MNAKNFLLAVVATCCVGSAHAQTTPASQAPATMASPNTTRSSMPKAATGVGAVVTDSSARNGYTKTKNTKIKSTMSKGSGKVKTKM